MAELTSMTNIGRELARKLTAAGIPSSEALTELGAEHAFFKLKEVYPRVCPVHLYALEGAIQNLEFNRLPPERKKELKAFCDLFK